MGQKPSSPTSRTEEAFLFFSSLQPEKQTYAAVAEHFGVNLTTVKRWGTQGRWRHRLAERETEIARKAADRVATAAVDDRARRLKMLELATVKLVSGIAEGTVRGSYGDLERLLRLEGFLKGTDQSIPREEVARLFDLFLLAIEREIDDPEQRQRIAQAIRDALDAEEAPRGMGKGGRR